MNISTRDVDYAGSSHQSIGELLNIHSNAEDMTHYLNLCAMARDNRLIRFPGSFRLFGAETRSATTGQSAKLEAPSIATQCLITLMPFTRFVFCRHGQSENNVLQDISFEHYKNARKPDPALTGPGKQQAEAAGAEIARLILETTPLTVELWSSPMKRAL